MAAAAVAVNPDPPTALPEVVKGEWGRALHLLWDRLIPCTEGSEHAFLGLLMDRTLGRSRPTFTREREWFEKVTGKRRSTVIETLNGLRGKGLIDWHERAGKPNEYWCCFENWERAKPIKRPEPVEVPARDKPAGALEEPDLLDAKAEIRHNGEWLKRCRGTKEVVVARDHVHAAVCHCRECDDVQLRRILSRDELEIKEPKPKLEGGPENRTREEKAKQHPPEARETPEAPETQERDPAEVAMQRFLAGQRDLLGAPSMYPTRGNAKAVIKRLGTGTLREFVDACEGRESYLRTAKTWGLYCRVADDVRKAAEEWDQRDWSEELREAHGKPPPQPVGTAEFHEPQDVVLDDVDGFAPGAVKCPLCATEKSVYGGEDGQRCYSQVCLHAYPSVEEWQDKVAGSRLAGLGLTS